MKSTLIGFERKLQICIIVALVMLLYTWEVQATLPVTKIASGSWADQSYFLTADGRLWGMGTGEVIRFSDIGLDLSVDDSPLNRPEQILVTNVTEMAGGIRFNYMLIADGTVWGLGFAPGQIENTNFEGALVFPIAINQVTAVAAGALHGLFLRADGSLWGVGNDEVGQLGDGATYVGAQSGPKAPEQIIPGNVKAIAAGAWHSLFLKTDGSLWGMGREDYGQLGDGVAQDGLGYTVFTNQPERIVSGDVVAIAGGGQHTLFLKSDGSLWGMGWNWYGQLGTGNFVSTNRPVLIVASNVVAIAAGGYHSLYLMSDGSLWGMGGNQQGQLGDGAYALYPIETNGACIPELIVASNVLAIAAGQYHSLFLKSDGSLWAMGQNTQGQLGDGFTDDGGDPGTDEPEQVYPVPPPHLVQTVLGGTDLQFTANCGFGGTFNLLSSTNAALPRSQWTPVWSEAVYFRYQSSWSVTLSNVIPTAGPQQFFQLQAE
jgi:alpha-tubulin suppressor-like RCC1 family protein